jgi:hypothetical protein
MSGPPAKKKCPNDTTSTAVNTVEVGQHIWRVLEPKLREKVDEALKPLQREIDQIKLEKAELECTIKSMMPLQKQLETLILEKANLEKSIMDLRKEREKDDMERKQLENKVETLQRQPMETENNTAFNNDSLRLRIETRAEKQEQYSRRESVRFFNVNEHPSESTDQTVIMACRAMGLNITEDDISVSHRVGAMRRGPRPIICKFLSRNIKYEVMKKKANLQFTEHWYNVKVHEDVTPFRSKVIRQLHQERARFTTRDGRIEVQQGTRKIVIDDLAELETKMGWTTERILGIFTHPVNSHPARI